MKFSFDIDEINEISEKWFYILDMAVDVDSEHHTNVCSFDEGDMRYIASVLDREPKLLRIMPTIIKESLMMWDCDLDVNDHMERM